MPTQAIDSTPDLVLLVVRAAGGKLSSITRLQKLVFLITENPAYKRLVDAHEAPNPEFRPYKMGPFTPELYEAVQVLTSFEPPLLAAKPASPGAQDEVETALFVEGNDLDDAEPIPSGGPQPAAFALTGAGKKVADYLWRHSPSDLRAIVDAVVRDYGRLPLRELLRRVYQRKPYAAHQGMFDATAPHGWGYYWKSHFLPPLTDDCIDVLVEQAWQKQSRASYTLLFHMGGAVARGGARRRLRIRRAIGGAHSEPQRCLDRGRSEPSKRYLIGSLRDPRVRSARRPTEGSPTRF